MPTETSDVLSMLDSLLSQGAQIGELQPGRNYLLVVSRAVLSSDDAARLSKIYINQGIALTVLKIAGDPKDVRLYKLEVPSVD